MDCSQPFPVSTRRRGRSKVVLLTGGDEWSMEGLWGKRAREHCLPGFLGKLMCCFYGIFMLAPLENILALYMSCLPSSDQICAFAGKNPRIHFCWAFPDVASWLSKLQLIITVDYINVYMLLCVLWARWYRCCYLHCRCNLAQMVVLSHPQMSLGCQS